MEKRLFQKGDVVKIADYPNSVFILEKGQPSADSWVPFAGTLLRAASLRLATEQDVLDAIKCKEDCYRVESERLNTALEFVRYGR